MQDEALHAPIKVEDRVGYFCQQWKAHRRDTEVTARLWTNMSLVGVDDDGSFSSVQVVISSLLTTLPTPCRCTKPSSFLRAKFWPLLQLTSANVKMIW